MHSNGYFFGWGLTLIPLSGGLYGSQFLLNKLLKVNKCYDTSELQKPEIVSSMYQQGVGTNASFKKIWCNEGFLPSSVGQFTKHSASWLISVLACCTNRSGQSVHAANSRNPPAPSPVPVSQISQYSWTKLQPNNRLYTVCIIYGDTN